MACFSQWLEHRSVDPRVMGLIPGHGHVPRLHVHPGHLSHIDVLCVFFTPSLTLSLKNKWKKYPRV